MKIISCDHRPIETGNLDALKNAAAEPITPAEEVRLLHAALIAMGCTQPRVILDEFVKGCNWAPEAAKLVELVMAFAPEDSRAWCALDALYEHLCNMREERRTAMERCLSSGGADPVDTRVARAAIYGASVRFWVLF